MFTGIINYLGKVKTKSKGKLEIECSSDLINKLSEGVSISVDGICLTVVGIKESYFEVDFIMETESRTNIKYLKVGDLINLELPATPATFLSGHIIQGHIDGVAKLENKTKNGNSYLLKFSILKSLSKYIVEKGSIAVNGISLTIIEAGKDYFTVGIIPHTLEKTMLQTLKVGEFVNIEVDILAKFMERLLKND